MFSFFHTQVDNPAFYTITRRAKKYFLLPAEAGDSGRKIEGDDS